MRQIIYIRTLRIRAWPDADPVRRVTPQRNVTPQAARRSIPVRVRGEGWLDKARRVLGRLGRGTGAWMRNVARP